MSPICEPCSKGEHDNCAAESNPTDPRSEPDVYVECECEHETVSGPKYTLDPMSVMWYAKINDVIGGWCITVDNKTAAFTAQDIPVDCIATEQMANHIARLHNQWLEGQ